MIQSSLSGYRKRKNRFIVANFKEQKPDKEIIFYAMIDLGLRLQKELRRNDTKSYDEAMKELTGEIESLLSDRDK